MKATIFQHYKGGIYELISNGAALESQGLPETSDDYFVVYRSIADGQVWIRPRSSFYETLPNGKPRFQRIGYAGVLQT